MECQRKDRLINDSKENIECAVKEKAVINGKVTEFTTTKDAIKNEVEGLRQKHETTITYYENANKECECMQNSYNDLKSLAPEIKSHEEIKSFYIVNFVLSSSNRLAKKRRY